MKHKSTPVLWMGMAFGVALALAAAVLVISGINAMSLRGALRLTAHWSFLLFWVAMRVEQWPSCSGRRLRR